MREILFRGKDIDGKWVQGYCIADEMDENKVYIGYIFGSDGRQPHDTDIVYGANRAIDVWNRRCKEDNGTI